MSRAFQLNMGGSFVLHCRCWSNAATLILLADAAKGRFEL